MKGHTDIRRALTGLLVTAALLIAAAGHVAVAQTASASLTGQVRTEEGDPVAEALVQARSESTGEVRNTFTGKDGRYRLPALAPGRWTVIARLTDGGLSDSQSVGLGLQRTTVLDFTVGEGIAEQVTVRAETPMVDRRETAGKLRVSADQADALPLNGRVVTDLALLDSSVSQAAPGNFFGERGSVFTVNGQSGRSNSFLVDGLDNNDSISGTTLNSFFSQQVIQEFVLLTHQYSAEFGRATGGMLNIVTRQGTNEPSWDAFAQGTSSGWNSAGDLVDSLPDSGVSQDAIRRLQTGVSFGGPIRKDKAFYFAAFEHQEADNVTAYTGLNRDGTVGGRMVAPQRDDSIFLRSDINLGGNKNLMFRLSFNDREADGVNVGGVYTPETGFKIDERDIQLAGNFNVVISPHLLSETRVLFSQSEFDQNAVSGLVGVSHPSGIFGGNILQGQTRDEDKFQIVENLTWNTGPHTAKFGFDIVSSSTDITARFNKQGSVSYDYDYTFDAGDCEDPGVSDLQDADPDGRFPCFLSDDFGDPIYDDDGYPIEGAPGNALSYPVVYSLVRGEPALTLDDTQLSLFAQDKVTIGSRWLLDFGLRYDLSTFELPASASVESTIPNGGSTRDTDNLAPRFGFTVTPTAKGNFVIRGGAGIFYDKLVLAFPAVAAVTSGTEILLMFPEGTADERPNELYIEENGLEDILANAEDENVREFLDPLVLKFSTAPELETPYTVQYNIGAEWGFSRRSAIRADIIRVLGYSLPIMRDLNPVSGLVQFPSAPPCNENQIDPDLEVGIPCHLRDPVNVGSIAAVTTEGRSWYTGVDINYRWRHEKAWLNASYTWSQSEDLGFDPLKGGIALPPNSDDLSLERGRSDGSRAHRMVVSGDLALPWMGLRTSTVIQASTGIPFNVTTGQDDNRDGFINDRPAGVGRNAGADSDLDAINQVRAEETALDLPPVTSLEEPNFFQIDFRLFRPFQYSKRGHGEVFLQVFNLLDRANWGLVEGRAVSPNFGRPIAYAGPPRTIELGLKMGY